MPERFEAPRLASKACAPSHVRVSSKSLKQFMDEAAAKKHRHYDDMATKAGATFVAFVVESNGGFGDEALQHLKKMIQAVQRAELCVGSGAGDQHGLQGDCGEACDRQPSDRGGEHGMHGVMFP